MLYSMHTALLAFCYILVLCSCIPRLVHAFPAGPEFQVNSNKDDPDTAADNDQQLPDVAMDTAGNFVVVFQNDVPGAVATVAARLYNAFGIPRGAQFQVNTTKSNDNTFPKVAGGGPDGIWVATWTDNSADESSDGVMARRFNATGDPLGANFTVNSSGQGQQHRIDIAMAANGSFVIVWEDNPFSDVKRRIRGQYFDSDGSPKGGELAISTDSGTDHMWPRVAMDAPGNFVVCWQSGKPGSDMDLSMRRFDAEGNPRGVTKQINGDSRVSNASGVHSQTSVAMDASGNFVVVWRADNFTGPGIAGAAIGILAHRFDADGALLGELVVDDQSAPLLNKPEASMNASGDWMVAYEARDESLVGVKVQRYYPDGAPRGASSIANTFTELGQVRPAAVMSPGGPAAVVVWESSRQDAAGDGVFGRILLGTAAQPDMDFNNDYFGDLLWRDTRSGSVLAWPMDGFGPVRDKVVRRLPLVWDVVGVGDFNRDGNSDILLRHSKTGKNEIWLMDGTAIEQRGAINLAPDLDWRVIAVEDFDRDGKADILWWDDRDGAIALWLMDGLETLKESVIATPGQRWEVVATDDFDGDGGADILLRKKSGRLEMWLMDGLKIQREQSIAKKMPDNNWVIADTGDINGDGTADVFWRNQDTGRNMIWYMNAWRIQNQSSLPRVASKQMKVEAVRDFNRDGRADVFWRHQKTGGNTIWQIAVNTPPRKQAVTRLIAPRWTMIP